VGDCFELLVRLLMMRPKPTSEEGGAKPNFRRRRGGLNVKFGVGGVSPTVIDDFTVRADSFPISEERGADEKPVSEERGVP
jgi:hypothetical protein